MRLFIKFNGIFMEPGYDVGYGSLWNGVECFKEELGLAYTSNLLDLGDELNDMSK